MKRVVFALAVLLSWPAVSPAEVYVYNNRIRYAFTGGGDASGIMVSGWTIISDAGEVTQVLAYPAQKRYAIAPMQSIDFDTVEGRRGSQYTTFLQLDQWTDGFGNRHLDTGGAKGINATVNINGTQMTIPKVYKWGGRSLYPADNSGPMRFEESSGVFTLNRVWTATCNAEGDGVTSAAQRLGASLQERRYVEF